MTRFLLDVNLLIALIDTTHVHHDRAHAWFASTGERAWATCPHTQNAVLRIVGNPRYLNSAGSPATVATVLAAFLTHPGHEFWTDDVSLLDARRVDATRLSTSSQITDSYLLAVAVGHGGKLATLDRRVISDAVLHGAKALAHIP